MVDSFYAIFVKAFTGVVRTKKDHPFLSGLGKFLDEEGLECEYELSTRLFFRIAAVAVFNFRSEGLHDLELSVFPVANMPSGNI